MRQTLTLPLFLAAMVPILLREDPLVAQEPLSIEVAIEVRIPQVLRKWGSAESRIPLAIADDLARQLRSENQYWTFSATRFDLKHSPLYGLTYRVWGETSRGKTCEDGINAKCTYKQELTFYATSDQPVRFTAPLCMPTDVECSDRIWMGPKATGDFLLKSVKTLLNDNQQEVDAFLSRVPIAERVHFEPANGAELWAVLPLKLDDYKQLLVDKKRIVKVVCSPDSTTSKRLSLWGPVFDEERWFPPPPPSGLALLLTKMTDYAGSRYIDKKTRSQAQGYKVRSAFIYPALDYKVEIPVGNLQ